jgi:hypothetical protein
MLNSTFVHAEKKIHKIVSLIENLKYRAIFYYDNELTPKIESSLIYENIERKFNDYRKDLLKKSDQHLAKDFEYLRTRPSSYYQSKEAH